MVATNRARALGWALAASLALPLGSSAAFAEEESSIARGGRLYDKWYKVLDVDAPKTPHPAYPADKAYAKDAKSNWRCKECHGWDTRGRDGAYASGKHASGIKGVNGKAGASPDAVVAILTDPQHGYADKLGKQDLTDLANFVTKAGVNYDDYIDPATKKVKGGNAERGAAYYNTICANCHGMDGTKPKDMGKSLGAQMGNPWEVMHKVLNGQPAEDMPALRALDRQVTVDILTHIETLPKEK